MNKLGAGISLIAIAAMLFIFRNFIHYLTAAILAANQGSINTNTLEVALKLTKTYSSTPEIITLVLAICFLLWAIIDMISKNKNAA